MQFFIITPPLLAAYIYSKRAGAALVISLILLTIISTAYISDKFSLSCSNADDIACVDVCVYPQGL